MVIGVRVIGVRVIGVKFIGLGVIGVRGKVRIRTKSREKNA